MKVSDPRKRRKLAEQVARNELSLVKLREKIDGRAPRPVTDEGPAEEVEPAAPAPSAELEVEGWEARRGAPEPVRDDTLVAAKQQLNDAVEEMLDVIRNPEVLGAIGTTDRSNLAKYLTIAKLRLENAIAVVRSGDPDR
jgi:hypothetical protein